MITFSPDVFVEQFQSLAPLPDQSATAKAAFLVAPAEFSLAEQSARDNVYMQMGQEVDALKALAQHAELAQALRQDCPVITFPGDRSTPDAVFPNNVFGTCAGRYVLGSMRHAVRQKEARRTDIHAWFENVLGYQKIDLAACQGAIAELTGSLIIDHTRGVGFCGLSERCNQAGAEALHEAFGLRLTFCFDLSAQEYHTNVVLALLAGKGAIMAADGFKDSRVPQAIVQAYQGRVVKLAPAQKQAYAANAITLNEQRVWMSQKAHDALTEAQLEQLSAIGFTVGSVDLSEIEKAGGSLRCCVGEIF